MAANFYRHNGKRALDITISGTALVVLSPILAVTAVAVRVKLGRPIIFRHTRPGKNTAEFDLYKFRTMTEARDSNGNLLSDTERITKFGSFLRRTSLDELPEFINIIKGDMSLVGPRPLLTRYLPFYTKQELRRFDIRPGLTGWAQIHGRNSVDWNERLAYDVRYAEILSLSLDIRIIVKTAQMVLRRQGVTVVPNSAMQSLDIERGKND